MTEILRTEISATVQELFATEHFNLVTIIAFQSCKNFSNTLETIAVREIAKKNYKAKLLKSIFFDGLRVGFRVIALHLTSKQFFLSAAKSRESNVSSTGKVDSMNGKKKTQIMPKSTNHIDNSRNFLSM